MRLFSFFSVRFFVLLFADLVLLSAQDTSSPTGDETSVQNWENFRALEAENPELAWEKLKLWFKNNGNIQHLKQPWKDFRVFKDSLILEHLKSTEDPVEQDSSEQKIEEAWREFEKVEEAVGGLSEEETVEVVLDKFREFYSQVKEEGESEERGGEVVEGEKEVAQEGGEEEESKTEEVADAEQLSVKEGEKEADNEGDETVDTPDQNREEAVSVVDEAAESDAGKADQTVQDHERASSEAEVIDVASGEEMGETNSLTESEDDTQANELEQKAAVESELVKTLSAEMLAKFEELQQENSALKDRISALESGLSEKIETLGSELEALKKQVEEESDNDTKAPATNVQEVKELISQSLRLFAADEVGMPDFALESSGAVVFTIGETEPYTRDTPWMGVFGISIWRSCKTPRLAIQKDNSPGNCWSFAGDKGSLTIQLSAQVFPEFFTMDHIPLELAPNGNASSAPNHFRVLGLDYGNAPKGHVLGNYEFTEFPIQTFAVQQNPYEKFFRFVKVEILSNHGNKDYTCLYRFRVHGRPHDTDSYNG